MKGCEFHIVFVPLETSFETNITGRINWILDHVSKQAIIMSKSLTIQIVLLVYSCENSISESWLDKKIKKFEKEINALSGETNPELNALDSKIEVLEHDIDSLDYSLKSRESPMNDTCGKYLAVALLSSFLI